MTLVVHTHGTEEGRGLLCPERRDAGGLVGACQPVRYLAAGIHAVAERLDGLIEEARALSRAADDPCHPTDLIALEDYVARAWAVLVAAQRCAAIEVPR